MRCFLAIDVPSFDIPVLPGKIVDAHHMTLHFFGELKKDEVDMIVKIMQQVSFETFTATTSDIGFFPSEKVIKIIWLGVEPQDKFMALQKSLPFENKKFVPHITLSRVKQNLSASQREPLQQVKIEPITFTVDSIKLKKSTLSPDGPVYEDLATFKAQSL